MRGVVFAFFLAAASFSAAAQAHNGPFDLAYRIDRTLLDMAPPAPVSGLPSRLEEFEPKPAPAPVEAIAEPAAAPPKPLPYVWDRIRAGFAIPEFASPLVMHWQAWYLSRPQLLKAMIERSRRYVYFVVDELDKRGMPTELALLPLVESGYNPMAVSSAQASGLWQFIPSTGKEYRLEQNAGYDARRDVIASTAAALDYLQSLFEEFGDWKLALASYNWGEIAVGKAIERNKARKLPGDYASIALPEETRNYVPKLQALKNIVADPSAFGIVLEPIPNQPYFSTVTARKDIDVKLAAKLADVPLDEFLALNPAHTKPTISKSSGAPIVLPVEKLDSFVVKLANYRPTPAGPKSVAQKKPAKRSAHHGRPAKTSKAAAPAADAQRDEHRIKAWHPLADMGTNVASARTIQPN